MPHQCTGCERIFPDGSKEMLSGCPDCGGNKFQFHPGGATAASSHPDQSDGTDPASPDSAGQTPPAGGADPATPEGSDVQGDPRGQTDAPDGAVSTDDSTDRQATDAAEPATPPEDRAQSDARREVVADDDLPESPPADPERPNGVGADSGAPAKAAGTGDEDPPDLGDLRAELNDQFESIKVLNPGQYELNLMELYDREEYIISLREDGKYVIDVPDTWGGEE